MPRRLLKLVQPMKIPAFAVELYSQVDRAVIGEFYSKLAAKIVRKLKKGRVLDVGTGPGYLPIAIVNRSDKINVEGVDKNEKMVEKARNSVAELKIPSNRCHFVVGSAGKLNYRPGTFDMVVSTGLIHHLKEPIKALNQVHKVLKKGKEAWMYDVTSDSSEKEIDAHIEKIRRKLRRNRANRIVTKWVTLMAEREIAIDAYSLRELSEIVGKTKFNKYRIEKEGVWAKLILRK